jgi:ribose 5-phosphate isomerase B
MFRGVCKGLRGLKGWKGQRGLFSLTASQASQASPAFPAVRSNAILPLSKPLTMLYIASDHGGYQLKKYLLRFIEKQLKMKVLDLGPFKYEEGDDFPDFAILLAKKVASKNDDLGILICKTGHGVCLAANKVRGVRAVLGYSIEAAEKGRKEENANVLCLAGAVITDEHAAAMVKRFLETSFEANERHLRRLAKIEALEK